MQKIEVLNTEGCWKMAKKLKSAKKQKVAKKSEKNALLPVKKEQNAWIVVKKKKLDIAVFREKESLKKAVKTLSLVVIVMIIIAYIALLALVATSIFYVSHLQNGLIQKGVFVAGISVAEISPQEATSRLSNSLNDTLPEQLVLQYEEQNFPIDLQELGVRFDVEKAIQKAYSIGRTQNVVRDLWEYAKTLNDTIDIEPELWYEEEILNEMLQQLQEQLPKVEEFNYHIENDVLIVNQGKSGVGLNQEELKDKILEKLRDRKFDEEIQIPTYEILPKEIDLQAIHNEIYRDPQDAYVTENPFEIHEQVIGVDFDVEEAEKNIAIVPKNEQYKIELQFTNPNIFVKDLNIFPDQLSTFSTNYVNNPSRTTNLRIAAGKINGTILMPGEKFSFNEVVGERTIAAGYKNAAIFVNGQVEDGLAGGICQISSTLYDAVIGANLQITERHNHSLLTSYLAGGKDATVVWGRYDFQFVNNREYPVKIEMAVQNGVATAAVYGIYSSQEYEITIESRFMGNKRNL